MDSDPEDPKPRGSNKFGKTYKLRDAVTSLFSAKIAEILKDRDAGPPGGKTYLAMYPTVLSEVVKGLTLEERQQAIEISEAWNRDGAPDDLKKKYDSRLSWQINI